MPTVVNIYTSKETKVPRHPFMDDPVFRYFFGEQFDAQTRRSSSLGSGVIVSDKGYILTNHHVVEAADEIEVALAGHAPRAGARRRQRSGNRSGGAENRSRRTCRR